jgi:hypothetical protein
MEIGENCKGFVASPKRKFLSFVRDGSKLIDIFNQDGEYLAQFETNVPSDWLSFNNGKAYAVAMIDDYKYIKRYNFEILGYNDN